MSESDSPRPLNRLEVLYGIRVSNLDAQFYTAFLVFTGGAFLIGFARFLGLNDFWLGVLIALPALVGILQVPGGIWSDTVESRKRFCIPLAFGQRLPWLVIVFLPLLASAQWTASLFILCVTLAGVAGALVNPAFINWLSDLVPEEHRGWFFARRTAFAGWIAVALSLPAGFAFDHIKAAAGEQTAFLITFGLGVACSFASLYFFTRIPEPPRPAAAPKRSWKEATQSVSYVLRDRSIRNVLVFFIVFAFATTFPSAFLADYMLGPLKMSYTTIQIFGTIQSAILILSTRMWGYLTDKFGSKPVVFITAFGVMPTMLMWMAANPAEPVATLWYLAIGHVIAGLFWSGAGISQLKLIVEASPEEHRTVSVGAISSVTAVMMGVAPLLAGVMMQSLRGAVPDETRFSLLFGTTAILRLAACLLVLPIRDTKSRSVRDMVQQIGGLTPSGVLALRALGKTSDTEGREAAVERLGDSKMEMAIEELERVLSDPQPSVRRKAVSALSKIGGDRAAQVIGNLLREHPEYVVEEMIEALAVTGTANSSGILAPFLKNPSPGIRLAAARALGDIGGKGAVEALTDVALPGGDPDLRRVAVRALGTTGAKEGFEAVVDALDASEASVRIVAAEAVADKEIRSGHALLLEMLPKENGMVAAEMAYALGAVGDLSDDIHILEAMQRLTDPMARGRAALGLARLYGVEQQLYRLFVLSGMDLDRVILAVLRRDHPAAAEKYSMGDENGSLLALAAEPVSTERIRLLANQPSREMFLLSVALLSDAA